MRVIAWHLAAASAAFAVVAIAACVGEDPQSSTPAPDVSTSNPGELDAPCNEGRCLDGLVCTDGVCRHPSDGSIDPDDAGSDAPSDGGVDVTRPPDDCPVSGIEAGITENPCPTTLPVMTSSSTSSTGGTEEKPCGKGNACCVATGNPNYCTPPTTCAGAGGKPYGCSGTLTCATGEVCCLEMEDAGNNPKATDPCPRNITKTGFKQAHCEPTACGATETRICRDSNECPITQQCRRITFTTGDGVITLGTCL